MARNKLRKEKELNQIKKSTNVFFNIIFIILSALCIFPIVFVAAQNFCHTFSFFLSKIFI